METDKQEIEIIELMEKVELKMSTIYAVYATKFADLKEFWLEIAQEEQDHARWLKVLTEKIAEQKVYINHGRFRKKTIEFFLNYLDELLTKAQQGVTELVALSTSHDIEAALLEKRFFEIFETDSAEVKEVLFNLEEATKTHFNKVNDKLQEMRTKQ